MCNIHEYYTDLLHELHIVVEEQLTQVHSSAMVQQSHTGQAAELKCGFEEICHLLYFLDIAPSYSHLFQIRKSTCTDRDFN